MLFNNEEMNVFNNFSSSTVALKEFVSLIEKQTDKNYIDNCGNEWIIEESNSKAYLIAWLISMVILLGLIVFFFTLKKKEKEKEEYESIDQERLIL